MKAIEPGCLCLHFGLGRVQECTPVRFVGKVERRYNENLASFVRYEGEDYWELRAPILKTLRSGAVSEDNVARESFLLRIDGIPDTVEREEKVKVFW